MVWQAKRRSSRKQSSDGLSVQPVIHKIPPTIKQQAKPKPSIWGRLSSKPSNRVPESRDGTSIFESSEDTASRTSAPLQTIIVKDNWEEELNSSQPPRNDRSIFCTGMCGPPFNAPACVDSLFQGESDHEEAADGSGEKSQIAAPSPYLSLPSVSALKHQATCNISDETSNLVNDSWLLWDRFSGSVVEAIVDFDSGPSTSAAPTRRKSPAQPNSTTVEDVPIQSHPGFNSSYGLPVPNESNEPQHTQSNSLNATGVPPLADQSAFATPAPPNRESKNALQKRSRSKQTSSILGMVPKNKMKRTRSHQSATNNPKNAVEERRQESQRRLTEIPNAVDGRDDPAATLPTTVDGGNMANISQSEGHDPVTVVPSKEKNEQDPGNHHTEKANRSSFARSLGNAWSRSFRGGKSTKSAKPGSTKPGRSVDEKQDISKIRIVKEDSDASPVLPPSVDHEKGGDDISAAPSSSVEAITGTDQLEESCSIADIPVVLVEEKASASFDSTRLRNVATGASSVCLDETSLSTGKSGPRSSITRSFTENEDNSDAEMSPLYGFVEEVDMSLGTSKLTTEAGSRPTTSSSEQQDDDAATVSSSPDEPNDDSFEVEVTQTRSFVNKILSRTSSETSSRISHSLTAEHSIPEASSKNEDTENADGPADIEARASQTISVSACHSIDNSMRSDKLQVVQNSFDGGIPKTRSLTERLLSRISFTKSSDTTERPKYIPEEPPEQEASEDAHSAYISGDSDEDKVSSSPVQPKTSVVSRTSSGDLSLSFSTSESSDSKSEGRFLTHRSQSYDLSKSKSFTMLAGSLEDEIVEAPSGRQQVDGPFSAVVSPLNDTEIEVSVRSKGPVESTASRPPLHPDTLARMMVGM